jgi:type I restriction enzyme, S subunit
MSSEWRMLLLGDVYEYCSGLSKPRSEFGSGHPFLGFKDVFYNSAVPKVLNELVKSTQQEQNRCSIKRGDLFLTRTSETMDELGMSSVALKDYPNATFNGFTKRLRPKSSDVIAPEYARYYFRSTHFRQSVNAMSTMSTRASLNNEILDRLQVVLPPLKEQQCIGYLLATLDDKIQLNRKTNETLEAMAKALFKSWFVDFDPVRAKAEGRPTGLPAEISDLFPDSFEDSELGEIPSGWRVAPVGDVVECVGGSTPSTNEIEYWDGGEYFWATPKDLSSLSEPFLLDTAKKITADGVQRISSGILPVGTILLSSRAPVGYVAAACVPVSINQGFIALKSNGLMSSAYLLNWCLSNVQQFKDRASGTTFAEISKAAFRPIPLLVPSEQVARLFSDQSQTLYERVVSNMRQSTLLAATRDALLPKLISGEIRIPDAEKMLEEVGI